jgi:D-3-phosphoglycerate dehydrogenase
MKHKIGKAFIHAPFTEEGKKIIGKYFKIKQNTEEYMYSLPEEVLLREGKDAHVLIVYRDKLSDRIINQLEKLMVIGCPHGGEITKFIDVEAATSRRIPIVYAPGRNARTVAEFTIGLMIAVARKIVSADCTLRKGIWPYKTWNEYKRWEGMELLEKNLGVIGIGSVGFEVAKIARALGMKILIYDPYADIKRIEAVNGMSVSLQVLLRESDFVTIHVPLTPETRRMIGANELSLMKRTAYLINTARGAVVDEKALYKFLKEGRLAGAALDVFEKEMEAPPFIDLENVIVTPHLGGNSREVISRHSIMIARDIEKIVQGEKPNFILNPSVLEGRA